MGLIVTIQTKHHSLIDEYHQASYVSFLQLIVDAHLFHASLKDRVWSTRYFSLHRMNLPEHHERVQSANQSNIPIEAIQGKTQKVLHQETRDQPSANLIIVTFLWV